MSKVFLSYSHLDKEKVRELANDLRKSGIKVWLDEWEIRVGDSILQKVEAGLDESDFLAIWLTKHALDSGWVAKEWQAKFDDEISARRNVVLPLLAEDVALPRLLRDRLCADFREDYGRGLEQLMDVPGLSSNPKSDAQPKVLFVLAGPSGVGKDVIQNRVYWLLEQSHSAHHLQKYTTRPPRPDERSGRPYFHLSGDEFRRHVADGIISCAHESFGNRYGCDSRFCRDAKPGSAVLYNIRLLEVLDDIRRCAVARNVSVRSILLTADVDSLLDRINQRTASDEEKATRSETARADVSFINKNIDQLRKTFDLVLENSDNSPLRETLQQVHSFIVKALNGLSRVENSRATSPNMAMPPTRDKSA